MLVKARKIAVVGSRSVGKSSITVRFVEDHFVESYYPSIENQFSMMNEKHLIGIHGYLLIYSVTSQQSFETVEFIRDKILNSIGNESIPMVLVGNKNDLTYQRQVETTQGQELAKKFNCKFLETSVRENINVEKAFETLIDEIEKIQNPPIQKQQEKCIIM